MPKVQLLDYVAGNVRSLVNAIERIGYEVEWVKTPEDVARADSLILPGVGHFGHCLGQLSRAGFLPAIRQHIAAGKPFMGICVGLQALFAGSAEDPAVAGLGVVPCSLARFDPNDVAAAASATTATTTTTTTTTPRKAVPHIGWNDALGLAAYDIGPASKYYYVHSYMVPYVAGQLEADGWSVATSTYGSETFVGALARGNVFATQFHPEKSGVAGLRALAAFLTGSGARRLAQSRPQPSLSLSSQQEQQQQQQEQPQQQQPQPQQPQQPQQSQPQQQPLTAPGLTRRVIACLDVRANDAGDLVVTKGDQYDVRDKSSSRGVRNLGKPVDMARAYYAQGADEITFLNITSFRDCPLADLPMLEVLRRTAATVFVPLTIGGGIRATVDPATGARRSALDVAALYFASGADKVSIGSDAVDAAEEWLAAGGVLTGRSAIEEISAAYGNQAVVVSIDPKRVYVAERSRADVAAKHALVETSTAGPGGETLCWYACTVKGGRETRDVDVVQLARAVEAMGAGEILLNCIDKDGTNSGFDLELINQVKAAVGIPVIASSGAGVPQHFADVFEHTATDAALGAGMFHRGEYTVQQVKDHLRERGLVVRPVEKEQESWQS